MTAPTAAAVTKLFVARRQRLTGVMENCDVSGAGLGIAPRRRAPSYGPDEQLRKNIYDDGHEEQRESDFDQRAEIRIARRLAEFIGNDAGHGVSGCEQGAGNLRAIADDHGYGHGLAESATEPQDDAAQNSGARISQNARANHLPPRGSQRKHCLALLLRNRCHDFARDRGNDRHDHNGKNDSRRQHPDAVGRTFKQSGPSEVAAEEWLNILAKDRHQHEDGPQSINHTRNGREQLRDKSQRTFQPARCHLSDEDRDTNGERNRQQKREKGREQRAVNEGPRAKLLVNRIPFAAEKETPTEGMQRQLGLRDQLENDQRDEPKHRKPATRS